MKSWAVIWQSTRHEGASISGVISTAVQWHGFNSDKMRLLRAVDTTFHSVLSILPEEVLAQGIRPLDSASGLLDAPDLVFEFVTTARYARWELGNVAHSADLNPFQPRSIATEERS